MINKIASWLSNVAYNTAQWAHQSIKETPVAGHAYNVFNKNISAPLWNLVWNLGCKVKDYAAPYFNKIRAFAEPKIRQNPIVVGVVLTGIALAVGRRVYLYFFPQE